MGCFLGRCPIALIYPTAGPYLGTYVPSTFGTDAEPFTYALGLMRDGWSLEWSTHEHLVNRTISWAHTTIEGIHLGADWSLKARALEYDISNQKVNGVSPSICGVTEALWPWGNRTGGYVPPFSPVAISAKLLVAASGVSQRYTDRAGTLNLTAVSGTTASFSPSTLTADYVINRNGSLNFDSKLREAPLNFLLLPFTTPPGFGGNQTVWFTTT